MSGPRYDTPEPSARSRGPVRQTPTMHFATFILRNLTRRPVRSGLTVLGLAATVASVIALLAVTHNIRRAVEASFERRRADLVVQQAGKSSGLNSDFREYLV